MSETPDLAVSPNRRVRFAFDAAPEFVNLSAINVPSRVAGGELLR